MKFKFPANAFDWLKRLPASGHKGAIKRINAQYACQIAYMCIVWNNYLNKEISKYFLKHDYEDVPECTLNVKETDIAT